MVQWGRKELSFMAQTFGQRLKGYRKAKNLTQQELAEQIGVSDKTVSRWESDGGYPDVTTLVPLARALGVTVDDLLDEKRPVRTLTRTDWQNLLSFAFALGGGVLFFLLDLFMPALLCYLAYLGCLAYGVYLQKYYAYQSRWFLLGEGVVDLCVNLTVAAKLAAWLLVGSGVVTVTAGNGGSAATINGQRGILADLLWWCRSSPGWLCALLLLLALVLTAVTQYQVWKRGFDGIPLGEVSAGHAGPGHVPAQMRLRWTRPRGRLLPAALVPLLAGLFWLPAVWEGLAPNGPEPFRMQDEWFLRYLLVLGLLATLPLLKKGLRRWIVPAWVLTGLCVNMLGLRVYPYMWSRGTERLLPYSEAVLRAGGYTAVGFGSWGTLALALVLSAAWMALSCLRLEQEKRPEP